MKHFPNPKRTVAAMLVTAMLACLASCGGKTPAVETTTTDVPSDTTTAEITTTVAETAYIDTLEKRDMGGREIIFYGQNTDSRQN